MAAAVELDIVYALHPFEAENPQVYISQPERSLLICYLYRDEISFSAGETIVVLERDDMFGDGWWQVHSA